ncbi:RNA 2'-phosphotransferase [uncultured Psychrobacillus sp.]|uniref:RNA 2'-phosphotransferase n=1 Tax=uncultured Psychrobacillus sp. TaxID=1551585 RepID=UPI00262207F0|nr:RNA 2'-phosphotransferase [uncultured Psychrobacillus sp.]
MSTHDHLSVFISLILRHKPETIGITLDEFGYANVEELLEGINNSGKLIDFHILQEIVRTDRKKRYSFDETSTLIRANQGHSIRVKVPMKEVEPPEFLYHGTSKASLNQITLQGIKKMNRLYVHLSEDAETALQVGSRHGKAVVLRVLSQQMHNEGHKFFLSENNIWQVDFVPCTYIIESDYTN